MDNLMRKNEESKYVVNYRPALFAFGYFSITPIFPSLLVDAFEFVTSTRLGDAPDEDPGFVFSSVLDTWYGLLLLCFAIALYRGYRWKNRVYPISFSSEGIILRSGTRDEFILAKSNISGLALSNKIFSTLLIQSPLKEFRVPKRLINVEKLAEALGEQSISAAEIRLSIFDRLLRCMFWSMPIQMLILLFLLVAFDA